MRGLIALFLVLGASGASVAADGAGRFRTVAVYVDAGQAPLAAYQVVITVGDTAPTAKIVGVEGGSADAFRAAPYYDPAALQGGRIIIAAFTTEAAPPRGRTHVTTLHLFEPAGCIPVYRARLVVAVGDTGRDIAATVALEPGGTSS